MSRVLDLTKGKNNGAAPSATIMETIRTYFDKDVISTALVVLPAAIGWVFFNALYVGLGVGALAYATIEYGIPAYRSNELNAESIMRLYARVRQHIRSRIVRA